MLRRTHALFPTERPSRLAPPKVNGVQGAFVVFEGGDGVGKSTQAGLLAEWLSDQGREVVRTFEPGDGPVNARIRAILLSRPPRTSGRGRGAAVRRRPRPARARADPARPRPRCGRGVRPLRRLDPRLPGGRPGAGRRVRRPHQLTGPPTACVPDLTVLLDLDPAAALASAARHRRARPHRVRRRRLPRPRPRRASSTWPSAPERYLVLPARDPITALAERIRERVAELLTHPEVSDAPGSADRP